jgi:hypothetical protein
MEVLSRKKLKNIDFFYISYGYGSEKRGSGPP